MTDIAREDGPTLWQLFVVFTRISLTSFGGGLSGWLLRELVTERQWVSEEEFLNGLAVSQALPGVNVSNMSVWIGYQLLGVPGVLTAMAAMILPAACVIILIGTCFDWIAGFPLASALLLGAGAAAIGLSLSMGITMARRVPRRAISLIVMAATFAVVAFLHWPVVWTVFGLGGVSVLLTLIPDRGAFA
jgi:chromate transporter